MQFNTKSWHARLYLRAYVHDRRRWLDPRLILNPPPEEHKLLAALEHERNSKPMSLADLKAWNTAYNAAFEAYELACKQQAAEQSAELSRQVLEQFEQRRLALCPYFWKVVSALLIYTCIMRPINAFTGMMVRFFGRIARPVGVLCALGFAFSVGYGLGSLGVYTAAEAPRYLAERQVKQKHEEKMEALQEVQEAQQAHLDAELKAFEETVKQKREAAQRAWKIEHAEEIKQREAIHAAWVAARQAETEAAEAAEFRKNLPGNLKAVAYIVAGCVLLFVFCVWILPALGRGLLILEELPWLLMALCFIWLEQNPRRKAFLERLDLWLTRWSTRRARWRQARKETWELFAAMAKATKERVCPFIEFVDTKEGSKGSEGGGV